MSTDEDIRIQLALEYISQLQQGDESGSRDVLIEICQMSDCDDTDAANSIYDEVGKITRVIHDSINNIASDIRMQSMLSADMSDARQLLNHVIETTEESPHKTMEAIETGSPLLSRLFDRSIEIQKLLETYFSRCDETNGHKLIQEELTDFMSQVATDASRVSDTLNAIMMAQGYQDLTRQAIQHVNSLVQEVEDGLVSILMVGSEQKVPQADAGQQKEADRIAHGPAVSGVTGKEGLQSQDDVDDLLSSLGF